MNCGSCVGSLLLYMYMIPSFNKIATNLTADNMERLIKNGEWKRTKKHRLHTFCTLYIQSKTHAKRKKKVKNLNLPLWQFSTVSENLWLLRAFNTFLSEYEITKFLYNGNRICWKFDCKKTASFFTVSQQKQTHTEISSSARLCER